MRPTLSWDGYVRLSFDEIRLAGAESVAEPARQPALDRQLRLLEVAVREEFDQDDDIQPALTPDQLGIGSGPDVRAQV